MRRRKGIWLRSNVMATRKSTKARTTAERPKSASTAEPKMRVGRPRAKDSDPNYTLVSLYLDKDVRNKVKARLFERGEEFSGLVELLRLDWLRIS